MGKLIFPRIGLVTLLLLLFTFTDIYAQQTTPDSSRKAKPDSTIPQPVIKPATDTLPKVKAPADSAIKHRRILTRS
jgi:hypothetical protein